MVLLAALVEVGREEVGWEEDWGVRAGDRVGVFVDDDAILGAMPELFISLPVVLYS